MSIFSRYGIVADNSNSLTKLAAMLGYISEYNTHINITRNILGGNKYKWTTMQVLE